MATASLVATGCVMLRKCHLNTCSVGIATQDPELRKHFSGSPEGVVHFFYFIAEEVRRLLAALGARTLDDIVGRVDLLRRRTDLQHWKTQAARPLGPARRAARRSRCSAPLRDSATQGTSRTTSTMSCCAAQGPRWMAGHPPWWCSRCETRTARWARCSAGRLRSAAGPTACTTTASGSGCAAPLARVWAHSSPTASLSSSKETPTTTPARDSAGGRIIVRPPAASRFAPEDNVAVGNTVLYGATSGELYVSGLAGERFAVRNSGATAVVEGVGDHGCEYMTGGVVVVLGATGATSLPG